MNSFNPLDYLICTTYPKRIAPSSWITHVPFAMFLVDALRPRTIVELGTYLGVSYCAFCQAVKELGLDTRCYGIDTWEGDYHGGFYGPEVLMDLRQHHDPLYSDFSQLMQSTFEEALNHFENKSVDLLHIDGLHTYEAVRRDFESWLPKMSDYGVMLFHDICVKEMDFGVWRLWTELQQQYPNFEMAHGCGLGLLVVGKKCPESLEVILQSSDRDMASIREFFCRLGAGTEQLLREQRNAAGRERRIRELEAFVVTVQSNPFFKVYHWIKYLGRE